MDRGPHRLVGEHDALGPAGAAARRDDKGVALVDPVARPKLGEDLGPGGRGKARVDGQYRVAGGPGSPQPGDEGRRAIGVDGDQAPHRG